MDSPVVAISALVSVLVQAGFFVRWIYRKIRNDELMHTFVKDMALNHLPHIYNLLHKICQHSGIAHNLPPPIQWVQINSLRKDKR